MTPIEGHDADVIVVGAGPTGLMLALELCLAGVRPLVLERQAEIRQTPKAGGLNGQIIELLRYRGLLERFEEAGSGVIPAPRLPFGGLHLDFTVLPEPPMGLLLLPQPQLEALLDELATEHGAEIRRAHEVVGLSQNQDCVTAEVRGSGGVSSLRARYLVGCDGAYSRVRELAGIAFPGMTYPEVQRLASVTIPDGVTLLENGDIEVEGAGRIPFGFTRTERGEFALGSTSPERLGVYTSEEETADYDDDEPMTVAEVSASIRRVLGHDIPLGEPVRLTRFTFHDRHVERYGEGRILVAGDAAHLLPSPGVALNADLMDTVNVAWKLAADIHGWAPDDLLDTYDPERRVAVERALLHARAQVALRRGHDPAAVALRELFLELTADEQPLRRLGALLAGTDSRYPMPNSNDHPLTGTFAPGLGGQTGQVRPLLLCLGDRHDLREAAGDWRDRIDIRTATVDDRPADAVLLRPDAYVAWAAAVEEPSDAAGHGLREALTSWFGRGTPRE